MEINPYDSRLRMLQQVDSVQQQREATPGEETAGCPGCPYFWTCPVPHRGEEVRAPEQIEIADVADQLAPRGEYRPRDESDVGWTDVWIETDEPDVPVEAEGADEPEVPHAAAPSRSGRRRLFRRRR
ncbi:hypothetical protein C1N80_05425 [Brachybacterium sp. SGAir0954]|uniref:hypothetical protein n=1 Tax=Brachybacterium sp. SGAir0954 TaxID=2571029 RepID=UPI0010CD2272|nr:hypothetical protein [Brachybacterium sp. SGAir0954]QCR53075.1 hypothetical protein C1N80_05425 [Brachybacterium sp. SGAir0954]